MSRRTAAVLASALLLAPVAPAVALPVSTFLVSVGPSFSAGSLPAGVRVTDRYDAVHVLQVSATARQLPELARTRGVRGIAADATMRTTGFSSGTGPAAFAPEAVGGYAGYSRAGKGVGVALVDTGVADTAALSRDDGNLVSGPDYSGDTSGVRDGYGHGTFMANLIAGGSVDGRAIGIAPAATVVDVKVADGTGTTRLSRVVRGLNWVAGTGVPRGIEIVSLSLAADRPTTTYGSDPLTDAAEAVQDAGAVVVVSAGNDPSTVSDPGQDPSLLTVGAADTTGPATVVAPFSGRGTVAGEERPDVVSVGVHVVSMVPPGSAIARANPSAYYGPGFRGSGTSQATAVVAGLVAIFLTTRGAVAPQDVRESFARAAKPVGDGDGHGWAQVPSTVSTGAGGQTSPPPSGSSGGTASGTASSWSASSWSASSWSASSWSASSWSASSWSASSWSASSWSASSWSATDWG